MRLRSARGLSLVEVVLALGVLAGVLISIAGLLTLGARRVDGGRNTTEALSVARAIVEEIEGWSFPQTWTGFGYDGAAPAYTVDTRANAYASKWQAMLDATLFRSHATIKLESLGNGPPNLDVTRALRVGVTVHWTEDARSRSVSLTMVRM